MRPKNYDNSRARRAKERYRKKRLFYVRINILRYIFNIYISSIKIISQVVFLTLCSMIKISMQENVALRGRKN